MLDNGYFYLAAARLSLFRSSSDWALVFEIFEYSPRNGVPDLMVTTFLSKLYRRDSRRKYATKAAYQNYLTAHPNNDARTRREADLVAAKGTFKLRKKKLMIPKRSQFLEHGIKCEHPKRQLVSEFARLLAATHRDDVLGTEAERRISVQPKMKQLKQLIQLNEWNHPNVILYSERPSGSETFRQLDKALVTGDPKCQQPALLANTDWRNWPDGGSLSKTFSCLNGLESQSRWHHRLRNRVQRRSGFL
jgi:hypothetical protein